MALAFIVFGVLCLACGFYAGWLIGRDSIETRDLGQRAEAAEQAIRGRHARSWPLRTTSELAALYGGPYPHVNGTQP